MNIVRIKIINSELFITFIEKTQELKKSIDINSIINNELLYSLKYISKKRNISRITDSLKQFVNFKSINKVIFEYNEIALLMCKVFNNFDNITTFHLSEKNSLSKKLVLTLNSLKHIQVLTCYFIPEQYMKPFVIKSTKVMFTFNDKFNDIFITINKVNSMKEMYFKKSVIVNEQLLNNFESFLRINKHIKVVNMFTVSIEFLVSIIRLLKETNHNNVTILIHQSDVNILYINEHIKELKSINKLYSKNGKREIRIVYNKRYIKNNLFKQLTYNNLKICSIIILYIGFVLVVSNYYNDFVTEFNVKLIGSSLSTEVIDPKDVSEEIVDNVEQPSAQIVQEPKKIVNPYPNIPTTFDKLLNINSDTVAWIKVNNTKINYPVVQSDDNVFYLEKDFYNRNTANGWIFMDYRNNTTDLDKNTILYGHSLLNGYMFGSLHDTAKNGWYKNQENLIITFNTPDAEMKWQVFSIYKIPNTSDYLKTKFYSDEQFMDFINLIKDRSFYDFNVILNYNDKILTLSTCGGDGSYRRVLHAKLIN